MDKMVIVGGGGHGKVVISLLKKLNIYNVIGYVDLADQGDLLGVPYLGTDNVLIDLFSQGILKAALGLGQLKNPDQRKDLVGRIVEIGFQFPVLISPHAVINEGCQLGRGTVIMDGVIIQTGTVVGDFSIINTQSSIDHDCVIADYVHIAPGATLCGGVQVGNHCLLGSGVTVIQGKKITDACSIGAGAVVVEDCVLSGTYTGCPARRTSN